MSPTFEPTVLKRKAVVLVVSKLWIVLGAHFDNNSGNNFYKYIIIFLLNCYFSCGQLKISYFPSDTLLLGTF